MDGCMHVSDDRPSTRPSLPCAMNSKSLLCGVLTWPSFLSMTRPSSLDHYDAPVSHSFPHIPPSARIHPLRSAPPSPPFRDSLPPFRDPLPSVPRPPTFPPLRAHPSSTPSPLHHHPAHAHTALRPIQHPWPVDIFCSHVCGRRVSCAAPDMAEVVSSGRRDMACPTTGRVFCMWDVPRAPRGHVRRPALDSCAPIQPRRVQSSVAPCIDTVPQWRSVDGGHGRCMWVSAARAATPSPRNAFIFLTVTRGGHRRAFP